MKKIIIIGVIVVITFILFTFLWGKSNSSTIIDTLKENNYVLDNNSYRKILTNNTQKDFYNDININKKSEYIEYQYDINSNELRSINMKYSKLYYLCNFTSKFKDNEFNYNCSSVYGKNQIYIYGKYDFDNYTLSCFNRNDNISEEVTDKYCSIVLNQIKDFVIEYNKLNGNKEFYKAVRGES